MPTLRNSQGQEFEVSDVDAVRMHGNDPSLQIVGDIKSAPDEMGNAPISVAHGTMAYAGQAPATADAQAAYSHKQYLKDKTSAAGAVARGIGSGLTFGASDSFFDPETIEADQAHHGTLRTIGTIGGALLPGLVGDEAGLAGLFRDPVAVEQATGALSSRMLYSGEVAAKGATVETGLARAGGALDESLSVAHKAAALPQDLAALDAKGLRAAREAELEQLSTAQATDRATQKAAVVDDMLAYRQTVKEANPWLVIDEGEDASRLNKANKTLRAALDDEKGLREAPGALAKPLRVEEKALENTIANREAIATKLDAVNAKMATKLETDLGELGEDATHIELSGKAPRRYASYADVKVGKGAVVSVAREDAQGFLEAMQNGEVRGQAQESLSKLDGLLEQNRALQAKIKGAIAPVTPKAELASARLSAINDAKDVLTSTGGKGRGLGEDLLGGSIMGHVAGMFSGLPVIGPMIGAKAGRLASDLVFGRMGKTVEAAGKRTAEYASKFLDVTKRAAPTVSVAATRVLSGIQYGPTKGPVANDLTSLYRARAGEIKAQTMYDPTGTAVMRPETRAAMAARLAPIRAHDPKLADQMETIAARKIEYLANNLPRRPDFGGMPGMADNWRPSDMEMRRFARLAHAVEDPHGVEERLSTGSLSPEDVEAYKAVFPERYQALKQDVLMKLGTLQKPLPFARRITLSIFTGVAVDPSLHPAVLAVLQGQYAGEDGSEGGSQAPKAQPQFGSVKADIGTASQQREGAMR